MTRNQLEGELRQLPSDTPPEILTKVAAFHWEIHEAGKINEGVPHSATNIRELVNLIQNARPTHLRQALDLLDDIDYVTDLPGNFSTKWSSQVNRIILKLYPRHIPPEKINHDYEDRK